MQADYAGVSLNWGFATDVGRVRELNEDAYLAVPPVFAVADGMGGHDAGEVASTLTVTRLQKLVRDEPPEIAEVSQELHQINGMLRDASVDGAQVDMGTTAVGLCVVKNGGVLSWLVLNIGDSRAYSIVDGVMDQVTHDHSYVQQLVDGGLISQDQARTHPEKNIITQALGLTPAIEPDFWVRQIRAGERFLLCSDGLTGEITDDEIASIVCGSDDPQEAVGHLLERAIARGGHDNVTVIVVDVDGVVAAAAETTDTRPGRLKTDMDPKNDHLVNAPSEIMDGLGAEADAPTPAATIADVPAVASPALEMLEPGSQQPAASPVVEVIDLLPDHVLPAEDAAEAASEEPSSPDMIVSMTADVGDPEVAG